MAVPLDVAVILDPNSARRADPTQVVSAEVDQHQMLGTFFVVRQQLFFQKHVLVVCPSAPPGSGDRMRRRPAFVDRYQRLRTGSNNRKVHCTITIRHLQ
ncbi:Uncharacterised protein [Mycobacterium tuberculosis]|nr:Uncharacterised protein [Mycobacterium tuberculosis]